MNNVVNFPTKAVRDWIIIEKELRESLSRFNYAPCIHERIVEKMKEFNDTLDISLNFTVEAPFPGYIDQADRNAICNAFSLTITSRIEEGVESFTTRLFVERLNREIDFCRELGLT